MGILDSKTRVLDTIITQEGRRQLADGKLRIEYVSFTDADAFYEGDIASGSSDPSSRIYFEATNVPHDQMTFEADDSGRLMPYRGASLSVIDGKVFSGSSTTYLQAVTGSQFMSLSETLLDSAIDNFKKLLLVKTDNAFYDDEREFNTNVNTLEFKITDISPFSKKEIKKASIDDIESLFQDKRLSHMPNFRYLPPVNREVTPGAGQTPLGKFPPIGQRQTPLTYDDIKRDIAKKDVRVIEFNSSQLHSNVTCQMFELRQNQLLKLDVIDYGEIITQDQEFPEKHVFFVGKLFIDSFGTHTFVNMFTLVFE